MAQLTAQEVMEAKRELGALQPKVELYDQIRSGKVRDALRREVAVVYARGDSDPKKAEAQAALDALKARINGWTL